MKKINLAILFSLFLLISCEEPNPENWIELTADTSLSKGDKVADGKTPYKFTAKIAPDAKEEFRLVTFKCSNGTFGEGDLKTKQVRASNLGIAEVTWIVPNKGGSFTVSASIGKEPNLYPDSETIILQDSPEVEEVKEVKIGLDVDAGKLAEAVANGESIIPFSIKLENKSNETVSIKTNEGTLTDGFSPENKSISLKVNNEGEAIVSLKLSTAVKNYVLEASLSGDATIFAKKSFVPKWAYADGILIEANTFSIKVNGIVNLTIYLKRNEGKVSDGTPISARAYQQIGEKQIDVGRFTGLLNAKSDNNQSISLDFVTDTGNFTKDVPVMIEVISPNQGNIEPKKKTISIKVNL